jgi:hypothetical protein
LLLAIFQVTNPIELKPGKPIPGNVLVDVKSIGPFVHDNPIRMINIGLKKYRRSYPAFKDKPSSDVNTPYFTIIATISAASLRPRSKKVALEKV